MLVLNRTSYEPVNRNEPSMSHLHKFECTSYILNK